MTADASILYNSAMYDRLATMEPRTVLIHPGVRDIEPDGDAAVLSREDLLNLLERDPHVVVERLPATRQGPRDNGDGGGGADAAAVPTGIALHLGTPGALAAAVRIFRTWLLRDTARFIRLTRRPAPYEAAEIELDAGASHRVIESALRRLIGSD